MPVGEYILEDGRLLVVEEEGMIADVREVSDEVPAKEEETTEDLEDETVETEVPEEVASEVAAIIEAVVEVIAPVIEEVKKEVEELKKKFSKFETEEETKEEEKKEELSKVKPIKHNPEAKAAQKKQVQFGKGKFNTTFDRVLNRLNK
jgi:Mg2+ and Co2+ transporter CorA